MTLPDDDSSCDILLNRYLKNPTESRHPIRLKYFGILFHATSRIHAISGSDSEPMFHQQADA